MSKDSTESITRQESSSKQQTFGKQGACKSERGPGWQLGWVACHPINQKVSASAPGQAHAEVVGSIPGHTGRCWVDPRSGYTGFRSDPCSGHRRGLGFGSQSGPGPHAVAPGACPLPGDPREAFAACGPAGWAGRRGEYLLGAQTHPSPRYNFACDVGKSAHFFKALAHNPHLTYLNLHGTNLSAEEVAWLSEALGRPGCSVQQLM